MKVCTKCNIEKPLNEFYKDGTKKTGYRSSCISCSKKLYHENKESYKEKQIKYYQENKDKIKDVQKEYREKTNKYHKERHKKWREENTEKIKKYREENKEKIKEEQKKYREENKEKIKEEQKKYREENKEYFKEKWKKWREENPEKYKKYREENKDYFKIWVKKRKANDPLFRLSANIRHLIYSVFKNKGYKKNSKSIEILGCSIEELKSHLEKQFTEGMNWNNRGKWEVDHIIPVVSAINEEELIKLNHYTNLQPLWRKDNLKKRDKYNEEDKKKFLKNFKTS